jgi:hypothetical protein
MTVQDLPKLEITLGLLYRAIHNLCEIDGTLEITNHLVDGCQILEKQVIVLERVAEKQQWP